MTVFHRELTKCFLLNTLRSVLVLMLIVMVSDLSTFGGGLSPALRMGLAVFDFVLPLALLVATLFTVGALAHHNELTALRAAGVSMFQVIQPLVVAGIVAAFISYALRMAGLAAGLPVPADAAEQTAVHAGRAYPLANLLAVFVGVTLAGTRRRRSMFVNFGRAVLVLVAFYVVSAVANAMGRHGGLHPMVAGWFSVTVFGSATAVFWWRANW